MKSIFQIILNIFRKERKHGQSLRIPTLIPSKADDRDFKFSLATKELPSSASINIYWAHKVKNQGQIGSCASHAICTAMEIETKLQKKNWFIEESELFHYYVVRQPEYGNTFPNDWGQMIRDGLKVANQVGVSPEALCRYDYTRFNEKPSSLAYSFAKWWKIIKYESCDTVLQIKTAIANQKPVIFGMSVDRDFCSNVDGKLKMPIASQIRGGHAMIIIGYDDAKKAFKIENSWGDSWGNMGYAWLPYDVINSQFFYEGWIIYVKD